MFSVFVHGNSCLYSVCRGRTALAVCLLLTDAKKSRWDTSYRLLFQLNGCVKGLWQKAALPLSKESAKGA